MYRSASANRIWDGDMRRYDIVDLPLYDSFCHAAKKEKAVAKFAVNVVHIIPLLLLFCAFLLWFFSNPAVTDLELETNFLATNTLGDLDTDGTPHFQFDLPDLDPMD